MLNSAAENLSKIKVSDGTVTNAIYDAEFNGLVPSALVFDGTYLWVGTSNGDIDGNNIFKFDINDSSIDGKYNISTDPVSVRSLGWDGASIWTTYNNASGQSFYSWINTAPDSVMGGVAYGICSGAAGAVFDGSSLWLMDENCSATLRQIYTGRGWGLTDLGGGITLYDRLLVNQQAGSFSLSGEANIGADLIVVGDLVVSGNRWGGSSDSQPAFGTGCADGQFAKGVSMSANNLLNCRGL